MRFAWGFVALGCFAFGMAMWCAFCAATFKEEGPRQLMLTLFVVNFAQLVAYVWFGARSFSEEREP